MSRSGYSDDCSEDILAYGRWRAQVASSIRGKRGQEFLRELVEALDVLPDKRLISGELREEGEVCALGALGVKRGINLEALDPEDYYVVADQFGIAHQLAQEVVFLNDEQCDRSSPEERWQYMYEWAKGKLRSDKIAGKK